MIYQDKILALITNQEETAPEEELPETEESTEEPTEESEEELE